MDHEYSCSSPCTSRSYYDSTQPSSGATSRSSSEEPPFAAFQQIEDVHLGVDLSRFAQEVWGLEKAAAEKILDMTVTPSLDSGESHWAENLGQGTNDDSDAHGHKSFLDLCASLLRDASKELGDEENAAFSDTFWDRFRQDCAPSCESRRVPDVVNTWKPLPPDGAPPSLATVKCFFELKGVSQERECRGEEVEEVDEDGGDDAVMDGSANEEEDHDKSMSAAGSQDDTDDQRSKYSTPPKRPTTTLKRSLNSAKDVHDEEGPSAKKPRYNNDEPALKNSLLPLYAVKALASSSRYYVVGLVVDRSTVTVCYFDRSLVACAAPFSFTEQPSKLALALYAMNRCDRHRAGFDPHLRALATAKEPDSEPTWPVDRVVGAVFEYPDTPSSPGICFRVTGVIRSPEELLGRATSVYKGQRRLLDGTFSEEEYIHKLSWPLQTSVSEADVVNILKARLPREAHQHLPELLFTSTSTPEDLSLPQLRLGLNPGARDRRVLRVLTGKLYTPLWEAGSIENFKKAWLDCVECLHLAYKLGGVLHRDVSEGNLMAKPLPDGTVAGVLNDWDMSQFVGDDGDDELSDPGRCTGTPPFMAIELLRGPMRHYLRHDLESLFYLLIWAALHYALAARRRAGRVHPAVADWTCITADAQPNWCNKARILLLDSSLAQEIFAAAKPEFRGVVGEWIGPLRNLFVNAHTCHWLRTKAEEPSDEETLGGLLTFKTFMDAIKATPRTWGIPGYLD
ncbi:hypothetical protein FA13DRAFT_1737700 [Coprinellus micaceus]|uniref:Fungal-type protein kinase domain-containing protein n=1 Tax=Coprinellus micaceus TaxID=71717 RepID=A0A4Y7SWP1_COPMI|nr:hypothetical protein FA13DRAFT_1737700 [Coprinellus micaceus]